MLVDLQTQQDSLGKGWQTTLIRLILIRFFDSSLLFFATSTLLFRLVLETRSCRISYDTPTIER